MNEQNFTLQDVRYVLKDEGNFQVRFPRLRKEIHFKDFFKMLQDPRLTTPLPPVVIQQAKEKYKQNHDIKDIFKILGKHGIPFHQSFQQLVTRKRRTSWRLQGETAPKKRTFVQPPPQTKTKSKKIREEKPIPSITKPKIKTNPPTIQRLTLTQALKTPFQTKRKRLSSYLPQPFHPQTQINVQVQKQSSHFYLPGKWIDCLNVEYNRNKNSLYVKTILWFKHFKDCFKEKIQLKQIVQFLKETADELRCPKIYLDDQSYIPVPMLTKKMVNDFNNGRAKSNLPPFFKVLLTLSEGYTLYMKDGFFCLPKKLIAEIDPLLQIHSESRDKILRNVLVINQAWSLLVLNLVQSLTLGDFLPEFDLLPGEVSKEMSVKNVAKWIKKDFQKNLFEPSHNLLPGWLLYDTLCKRTFGRPELFEISSPKGGEIFYPVYLQMLTPLLNLPSLPINWEQLLTQTDLHLNPVPNYPKNEKMELLCRCLWSLSSSFSETAMYKRQNGSWTRFHLPPL